MWFWPVTIASNNYKVLCNVPRLIVSYAFGNGGSTLGHTHEMSGGVFTDKPR